MLHSADESSLLDALPRPDLVAGADYAVLQVRPTPH
jgi:hypothetical protein